MPRPPCYEERRGETGIERRTNLWEDRKRRRVGHPSSEFPRGRILERDHYVAHVGKRRVTRGGSGKGISKVKFILTKIVSLYFLVVG